MSPERTCPDCGRSLPADAPRGLCPECLMGAALSRRSSGGSVTSGAGVLDTIAQSCGAVPRVLLRDTAPGEEPGPIVRKPDGDDADTSTRYRIDGEIARGGMGAILKGRDPDLGRDVALKVLREDLRENADMVRRFVEEAQIGGQLQHPGVVPIYELGTFADHRPFFAMKLVKGHTLAQLLADRRSPADDLPRFLSIFETVCQTMAYAHARGVIHRDLKPSNVMVGSFGEVQVMDWGLAKILPRGGVVDDAQAGKTEHRETVIATARSGSDEPGLSHAGSIMGTPSYMAPEQARGEIDVIDDRADVFALGSILAEIFTGEPAFTGRTAGEIQRKAALGDTAPALARLEACGADAELITLAKDCLARERDDRPRDASAVAKRITAYLASVQERLRRAELTSVEERARRRLTTVVAASVLALMALGGGGWVWVKADRDARVVALSRDVNDALNKATMLHAQASSATTGAALLFAQAREQAQRALALIENGAADAFLVAQVTRLQADLDDEEKDRRLVTALDAARLVQAETVAGENRFAKERAMPLFQEAFRVYGLPVGELEPKVAAERIRQRPAPVREAIVAALDEWDALASNKQYGVTVPHREWLNGVLEAAEPAQGWTRQFRAARKEKDKGRRKTALEKLATADDIGTLSVGALTRLAWYLDGASAFAAEAQLLRRAQEQHPADFWVNTYLGSVLQKVAPPERDEAVRFMTAAVALRPESSAAHTFLGLALEQKGQLDAAIASHKKAIDLDPKYAAAHNNLGLALSESGQLDAAIASYKKAIDLDPKYAFSHNNLGLALKQKGESGAAIASFKTAIDLDPKYAVPHFNLGLTLKDTGQLDAAIASYKRAIELDPELTKAYNDLGLALAEMGQLDAAIACYKTAIKLDPKFVGAHVDLGVALRRKGHLDAAIASYKKAIELDPKRPQAHHNLGHAQEDVFQFDAAIASFKTAIELQSKHAGVQACLAKARRLAAAQDKLPALLKGDFKPTTSEEQLGLSELCLKKKHYRTSAGLSAEAFAADPKLADDWQAGYRYNAACCAALAAAGQGEDPPGRTKLDGTEKARLRKQAIDWLRAELTVWTNIIDSGSAADRAKMKVQLKHLPEDSDLAGIRDAAALVKMPAEERAACEKLWSDVESLLKRGDEKPK
jgi:serine/threonine protein kinase/lipoprotein NlpI